MKKTLAFAFASLFLALLVAAPAAHAQTTDQSGPTYQAEVYGMVCNQCAYGVEQALLHTEGVKDAYVNLKDGDVRAFLKSDQTVPVKQIVQKITDQGISVRGLQATLSGRVEKQEGTLYFVVGGARYHLRPAEESSSLSQYAGQEVTLSGSFKDVPGMDGAKDEQPAQFVVEQIATEKTS
ncbi:MAG: heavy metal-associated domain-containing protein [Salinibacter sp.]